MTFILLIDKIEVLERSMMSINTKKTLSIGISDFFLLKLKTTDLTKKLITD
jgi:hypothetical protein